LQLIIIHNCTMAPSSSSIIAVPTKQGDGGGGDEMKRPKRVFGESSSDEPEQQQDAFSRYSNDLLRMKEILLLSNDDENQQEGNEEDDLDDLATINRAFRSVGLSNQIHFQQQQGQDNAEPASRRRRGNRSNSIPQGNIRKTRLSMEAHPSLVLYDLIEELDALDRGVQHVSDDEDEEEEGPAEE
jgi:hypothetical protein